MSVPPRITPTVARSFALACDIFPLMNCCSNPRSARPARDVPIACCRLKNSANAVGSLIIAPAAPEARSICNIWVGPIWPAVMFVAPSISPISFSTPALLKTVWPPAFFVRMPRNSATLIAASAAAGPSVPVKRPNTTPACAIVGSIASASVALCVVAIAVRRISRLPVRLDPPTARWVA